MPRPRMPLTTASWVTFCYALGYPIGYLAVSGMTPMAVLVVRFGAAATILGAWTQLAGVRWPRGRQLGHVVVTGLLMQAVQFCCLYQAVQLGAAAVLCAVVIAMNPVATAILGAGFFGERLNGWRVVALALGVLAVLAACASRLAATHKLDPAIVLLVVALGGLAAGGAYQQRFCAGVDFRATSALQNPAALVPAAVLAVLTPFAVHDPVKAGAGIAGVAMLFAVIPAAAGLLSWLMLGQRPDIGIAVGLVLGAMACRVNTVASGQQRKHDPGGDGRGQHRVDAVHQPTVAG